MPARPVHQPPSSEGELLVPSWVEEAIILIARRGSEALQERAKAILRIAARPADADEREKLGKWNESLHRISYGD